MQFVLPICLEFGNGTTVRQAFAHPADQSGWRLMGLWLRLQEKGVIRGCCWHRPRWKPRFCICSPVRAESVSGLRNGPPLRDMERRCKAGDLGVQPLLVGDVDGRRVARETELELRQLEQPGRQRQRLRGAGGGVSLPASNAMAPASASHLRFWGADAVAFGIYAHGGVLAVLGAEISLQCPELIAVEGFADPVTIGVTQKPIVAVERGKHSVQQGPGRLALWVKPSIVDEPDPPTVVEMRYAGSRRSSQQKVVEIQQAASQGFDGARALVTVMGVENIADKADALIMALQPGLGGVQAQMEALGKESLEPHLVRDESLRAVCQKHDIIHVTDVSRQPQLMFDVLVEFIEVDIGKKLARVTADRQAASRRCAEERLMRGDKSQKLSVATFARGRVGRVMGKYGRDGRPQHRAPLIRQWTTRQVARQDGLQYRPVDTRKKGVNVDLTVPDMARLTQQCLEFPAGRKRAPGRTVCIVVIDEAFVPPGFELAHDPVVTDAIGQSGRKNLSRLRIGDDEDRITARFVGSFQQRFGRRENDCGQINQCALCADSSADVGRTSEKFRNNHVKITL